MRAARVLPASGAVTSVTTVTTLGKGSWTYGGYTHAFSGVSVVCERREYRGYLVTAVTAMTLMTVIYRLILNRGRSSTSQALLLLQPNPTNPTIARVSGISKVFVVVGF